MPKLNKSLIAAILIFSTVSLLKAQQSTDWTLVSSSVWESTSSDGLVRIEARVGLGTSVLGSETMGCSPTTFSDPGIFGSPSLNVSTTRATAGTLEFYFFNASTGTPVYIAYPYLHVDKVGTFAVFGSGTGVFELENSTWTELSSNGPIFQSNNTIFNIDASALIFGNGGECGNGVNTGTGGATMAIDEPVPSINMDLSVAGGVLGSSEDVEFVLSNLVIANSAIEVTKSVIETFSIPVSSGDEVDYTITIENKGNIPVDNYTITDVLKNRNNDALFISEPMFVGADKSSAEGFLQIAETATYIAGHTLTQQDIEVGGIYNQVTANGDALFGTIPLNDVSDDGDDTDGNIENDATESFFPYTSDDSVTVCEIGTKDIAVLANDNFGRNGPSTGSIFIATPPVAGSAIVKDNTTPNSPTDDFISYTSDSGYDGSDTFTYGISDSKGHTQYAKVIITEQPTPDAGTDGTLTICEGDTVTEAQLFAELGGTPDSGGTWSPDLAGAGTYTYTVAATAPCTTDATSEVTVTERPAPDAGTDGTLTVCEGDTVTEAQLFAELGGTPDTGGTWSPALAGAGTYTYTVAATAPCTTDETSEVTVTERLAPDAGTDGTLSICEGDTVTDAQLFAELGGTPDSGGTWSPALAGAGTYTYTVAATAPCTTDETSEVTVSGRPAPDAGTDGKLTICEGDTVTEAQLFAELGGTPDTGGTWSPAPAGAGTYTYTVAATAPCKTDTTSEVTVSGRPAPDAGTDGTLAVCEGDTVTEAQLFAELGGTPDTGGTWSPALAGAGTYTYTVAATAPCTNDATSEVTVTERPAPDAGTDGTLTVCEGDTVTEAQLFAELGGTPDTGGTWSPALAGAGTYTYTVAATAPCTTDATSEVAVTERPAPDAGTDGTLTYARAIPLRRHSFLRNLVEHRIRAVPGARPWQVPGPIPIPWRRQRRARPTRLPR